MKGAIMLKDKGPYCMGCASVLSKRGNKTKNEIKLPDLRSENRVGIEGGIKEDVGCKESGGMRNENSPHPTETV